MASFLGRPFDIKPDRQHDKKSTLRRILNLKPEQRLKGQIYEVEKILQENSFLMRYAGTKQLSELIRKMLMKRYESREIVINQGDPLDFFYIILTGRISVNSSEQENSKVKELMAGNSFGETGLITGQSSQFTYITLQNCELILLAKSDFESIVKLQQSQLIHDSYLFFKGIPLLANVSEKIIHYFSQVAYIKNFMPGSIIVEQDEFAAGIYVVCEGSAKVRRLMENGKKIFIDELGVGELFCDNSFFTKMPMHHTVICAMPLVAYFLDKEDLIKLDPVLLAEFRKACKPYPEDQVLTQMYTEQKIWKDYKKKIIKTVVVEKELKR